MTAHQYLKLSFWVSPSKNYKKVEMQAFVICNLNSKGPGVLYVFIGWVPDGGWV